MAIHRLGFSLHTDPKSILDAIAKASGMTQSAVIESLLYGIGGVERGVAIVERGAKLREIALKNERELRRQAKRQLNQMDEKDLKRLLKGK